MSTTLTHSNMGILVPTSPKILLNPSNNSISSSATSSPDASTSSASSASSHTSLSSNRAPKRAPVMHRPIHHPASPARKIRFAPLPDPRRSVLITDNGEELPVPNSEEATTFSAPTSPAYIPIELQPHHDSSLLSNAGPLSKRSSDSSSLPASGIATPTLTSSATSSDNENSRPATPNAAPAHILSPPSPNLKPRSNSSSSWAKPKGLSIFSFKRSSGSSSSSSSSYSLTPTPSIDRSASAKASSKKGITTEEILTLGTINLFRTSSRESNRSTDGNQSSGWNLTRWTSAGSTTNGRSGVPLSRTLSSQSTQSYKSKTPSLLSGLRPSSSGSKSTSKQPLPNRKGTRMLNGRVYGSKRDPNVNLFANIKDEEPAFVEWGYGGMGSVKGAKSAGVSGANWERLHGATSVNDDDEDGSGAAWLKKRREAREKKEREAKEKALQDAVDTPQDGAPIVETGQTEEVDATLAHAEAPVAALSGVPALVSESATPTPRASMPNIAATVVPTPNPGAATSSASISTHHSAVPSSPTPSHPSPSRDVSSHCQVPAEEDHIFTTMAVPFSRPHHHRSNSRASAKDIPANLVSPIAASTIVEVSGNKEKSESETESSESESESEREDDEDDGDDEDEDEEDEDAARLRKMVIGAGMEKVSRHRTDGEEHM